MNMFRSPARTRASLPLRARVVANSKASWPSKNHFRFSSQTRDTAFRSHSVSEASANTLISDSKNGTRKPKSQNITVAVDGSEHSAQGLRWLLQHYSGNGSTINVVNVVNNDRVSPLSVGSTGVTGSPLTISFDEDFSDQPLIEYVERKVAKAQQMITDMYLEDLEMADVSYTVNVHVVDGQRSAAGIAEAVVQAATATGSDLLAVTSHGGGLHCSYGSVARYCTQHFAKAILLLPPNLDNFPSRDSSTVCVGVNTLSELQDSMTWALRNFCRGGDSISVLRAAEETMTGAAAGSDQTSIMMGLQEQIMKHHIDEVRFDLIQPDFESATASVDPDDITTAPLQNQVTADELLHVAETKQARALVMTNYATKGFLQEILFGTLALLASRKTPLPLLLIPAGHCFE